MDCFIIRVYRHIAQEDGKPGEIAGLVERVGRQDNGKPFSSYTSLVSTLREEYAGMGAEVIPAPAREAGGLQLDRAPKRR